MKSVTGNIWNFCHLGAIGIPTNGFVTRNGAAVMGKGLALDTKNRYPGVAYNLGTHLRKNGNVSGIIVNHPETIFSVPVKPVYKVITSLDEVVSHARYLYNVGDSVPGYHCLAEINIIRESLEKLPGFLDKCGIDVAYIPLLGCGNGGLSFKDDLAPILLDLKESLQRIILVFPEKS